jgi:molecular chaperone GrpE
MLPALDNLDRALQFAAELPEADRSRFAQFYDGIVLVNQQVNEVFAGMGIETIRTVGEAFDPHFHEAVAVEISASQAGGCAGKRRWQRAKGGYGHRSGDRGDGDL